MSIDTEQPDTASASFTQDAHFQHLMSAIPPWLAQASAQRRDTLKGITPRLPNDIKEVSRSQHAKLRELNARHWTAQNRVDRALANLQNADTFAEPLLQAAIKERFGLTLDVRQTFLRLYIPAHIPWLRLKSGAARIWTVSLLDAALHNFESSETEDDAFEPASTYINAPSPTEQLHQLPDILPTMPIAAFTRLCRELDIGERYKEHLEDNLGIHNPVAAAALQSRIKNSQKAALTTALHMAHLQNKISGDTHELIVGLRDGHQNLDLRGHEIAIMNANLTGIILFAPDLERSRKTVRVVAYIPDDPEHPLKEYASTGAFAQELTQRLRSSDYQRFFSRFVDHQDRGHFFAQLNNRLAPITWQPVPSGDPRPTWREHPNQRPNLQMTAMPIQGDLWIHLYQRKLDKILNDARVIAVSTALVDQKARWALWDSFTEIASALLNVAAFIALPFVPLLGEAMLAYIAYQLLDETFEGIVDWAEGQTTEALEHFMTTVESAVQLGIFAAGGALVVGEFRSVLPREVVELIDRFKPVKIPSGETRYWKPDLVPYEQRTELPKGSTTNDRGLHIHQGKALLKLDEKLYAVIEDPETGQSHIDHPTRPDAYKPALKHNGEGIWQTEVDQPLEWDQSRLLHRIGPDMERFSTRERERMLKISGVHENALRKMHVDVERLPPLLADTLKRFKIEQDIQTFIDQMNSDRPEDFLKADPVTQLELLHENGYWPGQKSLRLIDGQGQPLWQSHHTGAPDLQIDVRQLNDGDLLKTLLLALNESEIKTLLGEEFGAPITRLDIRTRTLRRTLAQIAERKRETLFDYRYRRLEHGTSDLAQTIIDAEPGLPKSLAEAVLDTASEQERQQLERGTLPARLADLSREAGLQTRVSRAYEGLELKSTANNLDTQRLALHSLEHLPGWSGQLRIELHQYNYGGQLIDSVGNTDAPLRKVLVMTEEGPFQAYDGTGRALHSTSDFYTSLLQAFPDSERNALRLNIGEGEKLRLSIGKHALSREELRALLSHHPIFKPTYEPSVMRLLGGADGYRPLPKQIPTLQARAQALFPHLSAEDLQAFVERLQQQPSGPRAELTRLIAEHERLRDGLQNWVSDIPQLIPDTDVEISAAQLTQQQRNRRQFMNELLDCWRRQTTHPPTDGEHVDFIFTRPILGELPTLNVSFDRVTNLALSGNRATKGVNGFMRRFAGLRRLALRNFNLGNLPDAITQWPHLNELILSDCALTLTPQSQATLSALNNLVTLDLYQNPLGLLPNVENMPALEYIDVAGTHISSFPTGLLTRPYLRTALLNDNRIAQLPTALFELPRERQNGFDLGGNPIAAADRERIKRYFMQTGQDFGFFADQDDIHRLQRLYPGLDQEQASDFIYRLPGTLADGRTELARLEAEYETLRSTLEVWTTDIPTNHPISGQPLTPQERTFEELNRFEFKRNLEKCWRHETDMDDLNEALEPTYELTLTINITGNLPVLDADFSHVSMLYLHSHAGLTSGAGHFLENFPRLRSLTIREYTLGEIPEAVFRMGDLTALALTRSQVTLTTQSVIELAQMEHMDYLELSNNPLGLAPDVSQMPDLSTLLLNSTGITELPKGLLQLKSLDVADLSANQITEIPSDILELPLEIAESINLRGNPLNEQSLQTLIAYFKKTTTDFGVEAVIQRAEMEVSTSEDSEPDE
ncbi:Leucine-rich repeat (LRR) protein [Pseudomonas sp. S30_BP2TU TE3576]|uniref:dermonecrotic toxin domain-containing protein n=1 Tax=Pseudomonas sp. S30_BP2TU TE3576 TaxID=3349329 RepID=UPI003D22B53C